MFRPIINDVMNFYSQFSGHFQFQEMRKTANRGAPFIIIDPAFEKIPSAKHFIMKHEVGRIYLNHGLGSNFHIFTARVINFLGLCTLTTKFSFSDSQDDPLADLSRAYLTIGGIAVGGHLMLNRLESYLNRREGLKAEDFGIQVSTDQELIDGRSYFQALEIVNKIILRFIKLNELKLNIKKIPFELTFDHFKNGERIQKIEREMSKRGMNINALDANFEYQKEKESIVRLLIKREKKKIRKTLKENHLKTSFDAEALILAQLQISKSNH